MKREHNDQSLEYEYGQLMEQVQYALQQPDENHDEILALLDKIKKAIQEISLNKASSEAA